MNPLTPLLCLNDLQAHNLKRNIGQFSGYVWTENEVLLCLLLKYAILLF